MAIKNKHAQEMSIVKQRSKDIYLRNLYKLILKDCYICIYFPVDDVRLKVQ